MSPLQQHFFVVLNLHKWYCSQLIKNTCLHVSEASLHVYFTFATSLVCSRGSVVVDYNLDVTNIDPAVDPDVAKTDVTNAITENVGTGDSTLVVTNNVVDGKTYNLPSVFSTVVLCVYIYIWTLLPPARF